MDKFVEVFVWFWFRFGKLVEFNWMFKFVEFLYVLNVGVMLEFVVRVLRDGESLGFLGRDVEVEVLYNFLRFFCDGFWCYNFDVGLFGKLGKNVEYLGWL